MSSQTMQAKALELARQGFSLLVVAAGGRKPVQKAWPEKATTDPATIKKWWPANSTKNIGIAAGHQRDLLVLDVDVKKDKPGLESLDKLREKGLPATYTVSTPSGGLHLYYKSPGINIPNLVDDWYPGIDIRSYGGQVVAPGSVVDGVEYKVIDSRERVALPLNIAAELYKVAGLSGVVSAKAVANSLDTGAGGTGEFSKIPESIPAGGRDGTVNKWAWSLAARMERPEAEAELRKVFEVLEQPPGDVFSWEQCEAKLDRAYAALEQHATAPLQTVTVGGEEVRVESVGRVSLDEALERFVLITVKSRVADLQAHPQHAVTDWGDWSKAYANQRAGEGKLPAAWLASSRRRAVRDTIFFPEPKRVVTLNGEQFYNTYAASGVGDGLPDVRTLPAAELKGKIEPFLEHLKYLYETPENMRRMLDWCTYTVQRPMERIQWCPLTITKQGVGKGSLYRIMQRLLGHHNCRMILPHEYGANMQFNGFLSGSLLVCIDEMHSDGKWASMNHLKSLITENTAEINHKHGAKRTEQIFANMMAFSNHIDAAAVDDDDRRFWVHRTLAEKRPPAYYVELNRWIEGDGPGYLYNWMMARDMSNYNPGEEPPMTEAKAAMIEASRGEIENIIRQGIVDRSGPFQADIVDATLIQRYVELELDEKLDGRQRRALKQAITSVTSVPDVARPIVQLAPGIAKKRLSKVYAVRSKEHWQTAPHADVAAEYVRAWQAAHNGRAELQAVNN